MLAAGLGWLGLAAANAAAIIGTEAWRNNASLLEMVSYAGRQPALCGLGFGNVIVYEAGGYTFLHRPIPTYHSIGVEQDFIASRPAYNALLLRKDDMGYFESLRAFSDYAPEHCNDMVCLLVRPGGCTALPNLSTPIGELSAATKGPALSLCRRDYRPIDPTPSLSANSHPPCRGSPRWSATSGRDRPAAPDPWSCRRFQPWRR